MVPRHIDTGFTLPGLSGGNAVGCADAAGENRQHQGYPLRANIMNGVYGQRLKRRHDKGIAR